MKDKKLTAIFMICVLYMFLVPCQSAPLTVPLRHFNVTMDFEDYNVTVEERPTSSSIDSSIYSTFFRTDNSSEWAAIYLYESREGTANNIEDTLRILLKPVAKRVEVGDGYIGNRSGYTATGEARVEHGFGFEIYGGILPLPYSGTGSIQYFAMISHFQNQTFNKKLVSKTLVEYSMVPTRTTNTT